MKDLENLKIFDLESLDYIDNNLINGGGIIKDIFYGIGKGVRTIYEIRKAWGPIRPSEYLHPDPNTI